MQYLLFIHILTGSISLIAAACAVLSSKGKKSPHYSGKNFTFGEWLLIFLTAIPMSIVSSNLFNFLVAYFFILLGLMQE